ncbi:NADPH:quinone oxidoreductase family protein [Amorphus orientalis]|uniref:NADPH2:quinone reductase n=1 Tax=Amorphus orientalis TaxID=649198 RepID=A0AAE3VKW4_9HYPH|nr:NADPH:quinone oxidoreductase family protein [Amorphus orientalis]MDQ0313867.1 NADPH2:quinone reductase [Amorphus orientalis]
MRAILSREPGPPSSLMLDEIDAPEPGPGEVAVAVEVAALNFFDTLIIADRYQFKPDRPFSPGAEMAGRVTALGSDVTGLAVGDRVIGYLGWGCCREVVTVEAADLVTIPDGVASEAAAGLIVTYGTTLYALRSRGDLQAGETLAVLGASGGTGQAAVEIGKLLGARVIAGASSPDKVAFARSLGADEGIDYGSESLKERLKALTGGRGVDVVYDPVGGELAEEAVRATAWLGRFLVIGFASGEIPKLPLNLALLKSCDIRGVFWGAAIKRDPAAHRADVAQLLAWVQDGSLKPHIDTVYPLEETSTALDRLAARDVKGKLLIRP